MFYTLSLKTLLCVLLASPSWAAPKKTPPMTHYMAIATANSVNRWGTVEEYRKALGRYISASEMAKLNSEFTKYGVKPTDRFPKMMSKENKAYFDKENYILYDKKSMTVNGKKLSLKKATPADLFVNICNQIGCLKTTASFSLFPKANAKFNTKAGFLAGLALFAGASFMTLDRPPEERRKISLRALAVGIIGGGFFADELIGSCGGKCETQCDGDDYSIRRQDDYRYMNETRRGYGRGGDDRSGATRIYADDFRNSPNDYQVGDSRYSPCGGDSPTDLACDIGARNCNGGGGSGGSDYRPGNELNEDIGGATVVDKYNGEAKRGTTSLPVKKK